MVDQHLSRVVRRLGRMAGGRGTVLGGGVGGFRGRFLRGLLEGGGQGEERSHRAPTGAGVDLWRTAISRARKGMK